MKVRKFSVSTQIFIMITCLVMGACGIIGVTLYNRTGSLLITQMKDNATQWQKLPLRPLILIHLKKSMQEMRVQRHITKY